MLRLLKLSIFTLTAATGLIAQTRWLVPGGDDLDVDVTGRLYVLNGTASTIRVYDEQLRLLGEFGGPGWEDGRFDQPSGIWAENGLDLFVADRGNHRIQRFDRQFGHVSTLYAREDEDPEKRFGYPADVLLSRQGELFISDGENLRIAKVDRTSQVERTFGGLTGGTGRLSRPGRLAIGPRETLYVIDGARVMAFDTFGNFLRSCYEGIWEHPTAILGDPTRILLVDGGKLYCCEREDRGVESSSLALLAPMLEGDVRGIGSWRGRLYLVGGKGVAIIDDPWPVGSSPPD
jgi:hypothetical protein